MLLEYHCLQQTCLVRQRAQRMKLLASTIVCTRVKYCSGIAVHNVSAYVVATITM